MYIGQFVDISITDVVIVQLHKDITVILRMLCLQENRCIFKKFTSEVGGYVVYGC